MTLNLAISNVRRLRDSSKCACLLAELKNLRVIVTAVQETHFICAVDCWVLGNDFNVFSAYGSCSSAGVTLLVRCSLDVDDVFAGDGANWLWPMLLLKVSSSGWLWFMHPISLWRRVSFFRRLAPFLDDSKRLVLGDWNAIFNPKIDKVGWGARRLGRCESRLVNLMTHHDLVDRFCLDHLGWKMWTWLDRSPSAKVGSYLEC